MDTNNTNTDFNEYKKLVLNRITDNGQFIDFLENCLAQEIEYAKHSYHKIMVHEWIDNFEELADSIKEHYFTTFIPVKFYNGKRNTTFYTCNLNLVLQAIRSDFKIPLNNSYVGIQIVFNDKSSIDLFGTKITLEDIVSEVISNRLSEDYELDLSNFSNDPEFIQKNIYFYRITLLSIYKRVMLRIAQITTTLNLSNNGLVQVPSEILNFFIKGDLTAINLSYNKIPSLKELVRVSSRIEKLWLEGNPLCDERDSLEYVRQLTVKFPRLKKLDDIAVNQHGVLFPFWRNYVVNNDRTIRMLAEKFISLYFSHYDSTSRSNIGLFYDEKATLTISCNFTDAEEQELLHYHFFARNIMHPVKKMFVITNQRTYNSRDTIVQTHSAMPATVHDPATFTVDVVKHDKTSVIIIVDGIFKHTYGNLNKPSQYFQFRRTFVFLVYPFKASLLYAIKNEMFSVSFANKVQIDHSFKTPTFNLNTLALVNPGMDEINALCQAFGHLTNLKRKEVMNRLQKHNWDIREALQFFADELRNDSIPIYMFKEEEIEQINEIIMKENEGNVGANLEKKRRKRRHGKKRCRGTKKGSVRMPSYKKNKDGNDGD